MCLQLYVITVKAFQTSLLLHADSQPSIASTASLLQAAKSHATNAAQPSCGLRGKPGSSSPAAAIASGNPSGKSSRQPAQPSVTLISTPKPKPSATTASQADGAPQAAEISLPAHNDSSASSTPVQLAAPPESSAGAALLPHTISAQKLPHEQASKRNSHEASALLPVPKAKVPAVSQVNVEPVGKAAAALPQVHLSIKGVMKDTGKAAAATPQVAQSKTEGAGKDTDSLLMVRRLPAVLAGTLPTLESLGAQVNLPSGADMLSKASFLLALQLACTVLSSNTVCFCCFEWHCSMYAPVGSMACSLRCSWSVSCTHDSTCLQTACLYWLYRAPATEASGFLCQPRATAVSPWNGQSLAKLLDATSSIQ